ncbi:MAG TPA: ATP synthase F0 subunit B [bacterium]
MQGFADIISIENIKLVLINLVVFIIVWQFLKRTLFRAVMIRLEEREKIVVLPRQRATELTEKAENALQEYERRSLAAKTEIKTMTETKIAEIERNNREVISLAKEDAQKIIEEIRKGSEADIISMKSKLQSEIPAFAGMIASRVIGRGLKQR